ncbi:MAG: YitT family protein, partial [Firmicutes bacterium]|nr:YitT family protein [Bacillota bacterium]
MNAALSGFLNRETLMDLFMIFVGSVMWVIALICLIVPSGLLSVGFSGISILITNFVPIPLSVVVYALNVPFMIWAWKELRKRFLVYTLFTLTLQSVLMEIMEALLPVYTGDVMLSAIFAGVIGGLGSGIVIRYGGSGGGVEV